MDDFFTLIQKQSFLYPVSLAVLFGLIIEAFLKRKTHFWYLSAVTIYITVGIWYLVEPIYTPESLEQFDSNIVNSAYTQVIIFLIFFRIFLPFFSRQLIKRGSVLNVPDVLNPEQLLLFIFGLWLGLLVWGTMRLRGDLFWALFPIDARLKAHMWSRHAGAQSGDTGFLVSAGSYLYTLSTAFFGILLPLQKKIEFKAFNIILLVISLPYFALQGARNLLLAVTVPMVFSFALFSKQKIWIKIIVIALGIIILNQVLFAVIQYRNYGFAWLFDPDLVPHVESASDKHRGLNMLEELCYINSFLADGSLNISYGGRYFDEVLNAIPRAILPDKPLIGIDYAVLRGFGGNTKSDIGVFATISTGMIGQGVINFGTELGPIAASFVLSIWGGILSRLWIQQEHSTFRRGLFLVALGLTFNMGRDITLLVLWPVIFGYAIVRLVEKIAGRDLSRKTISMNSLLNDYDSKNAVHQ